jgi:hypothetical protein
MKIRIGVVLGALAALAFAATAIAAPSPFKITGGGQTFATADAEAGVSGPGDTITFQAFIPQQGTSEDSTGRINIIDRTPDAGGKGVHYQGVVECSFLETDPAVGMGYAELRGRVTRSDSEDPQNFLVRIQDNGQGAAAEDDLVSFEIAPGDAPECEDSRDDQDDDGITMTLARGNAKIHKENTGASKSSSAKSKSTSTTTQSTSLTSALSLR